MATPASALTATAVFFLLSFVPPAVRAQQWERDASFVPPILESTTTTGAPPMALSALPDSRVLVAHQGAIINGQRTANLVRLNRDGTTDPSYVVPALAGRPSVIHMYPDGRALVKDGAGLLVRLLADGKMDPAFASTPLGPSAVLAATVTATGSIWVWGDFHRDAKMAHIALLKAAGGWDEGFLLAPDALDRVTDAAVQTDGRLIVARQVSFVERDAPRLFRLNQNGTVDPSFDTSATFNSSSAPESVPLAVAALPDGKILAASRLAVRRFLGNGALDATYQPAFQPNFGSPLWCRATTRGVFYYLGSNVGNEIRRMASDGTTARAVEIADSWLWASTSSLAPVSWDDSTLYFATGFTPQLRERRQWISRVESGALDPAFAPRVSLQAGVEAIVRQADGKYLASGSFDFVEGAALTPGKPNLVRLNADGTLDRSFRAPESTTEGITHYPVVPIGTQPDGKIIVSTRGGFLRLNADGGVDASFPSIRTSQLKLDGQGYLYTRITGQPIVRLRPDGTDDPTFSAPSTATGASYLVALDGRVVVGRSTGSSYTLSWLKRDGSVSAQAAFANVRDVSLSILPDAGVVACGDITTTEGLPAWRIHRFDATGAQVLLADVAPDILTVAGVLHDALVTLGGGEASFESKSRGQVIVHDHEMMLGATGTVSEAPSLLRLRPRDTAQPVAALAPAIFLQPKPRALGAGLSATFTVNAYGADLRTYQWFKNGAPLGAAREKSGFADSLVFSAVQPADEGDYSVQVTNAFGRTTSATVRLRLLAVPTIASTVSALTVAPGQTVALTINTTGENLRYVYLRDQLPYRVINPTWAPMDGGTATLLLPAIAAAEAGVYRILVSNGPTSAASRDIALTVVATTDPGRLANVSVRTRVGAGDQSLIVGFVVAGASAADKQPVLMRAIGPALAAFGVTDALADPALVLRSADSVVGANDNWGGDARVATVAAQVGAFPLAEPSSRDAAFYAPALAPAAYTVEISGATAASGTALAEIYDATPPGAARSGARLVNLSSRAQLAGAGDALIAGFVISGTTASTVLVRAVGPSLTTLGVQGALAAGQLTIFDARGNKMTEDLGNVSDFLPFPIDGQVAASEVAPQVGAFPLRPGFRDNAVVITLPPGAYTAQARGLDGAGGVALIEVYEVP